MCDDFTHWRNCRIAKGRPVLPPRQILHEVVDGVEDRVISDVHMVALLYSFAITNVHTHMRYVMDSTFSSINLICVWNAVHFQQKTWLEACCLNIVRCQSVIHRMGLARASATRSHFLEISQKPMWEAPRSHVGKLPEAVLESSQKPCWKAPRSHFGKLPETCWPKGSCGLVIVLSSVRRVGPHVGDFVRTYLLVCVVHNVVFSAPMRYVRTYIRM